MPTALAISPHLDDAVFSAGGTLAALAKQGWRVVVATVFTASVPNPQGFALACQIDKGLAADVDYMALRRAEDAAACARIGAEHLWLSFAEAPHRGYRSAADLFSGLHDDDGIVEGIMPALADLIGQTAPDEIFSPQALGAHVDHTAVYLALRDCGRPQRLWADFPYSIRTSPRPSPFAGEIARLAGEEVVLDPEDVEVKADAAALYASQLGFQFGGVGEAKDAIRTSGHVETFCVALDAGDVMSRPFASWSPRHLGSS